jgi:hypothetical protein
MADVWDGGDTVSYRFDKNWGLLEETEVEKSCYKKVRKIQNRNNTRKHSQLETRLIMKC